MLTTFLRFLPLLLLSTTACAVSTNTDAPYVPPAEEPNLTFGESEDTASADGPELFGKSPSNPNPKTLQGVYERTGYASENRPSDYLVISNDWRSRLELRKNKVVAAIECKIDVGGRVDAKQTLYAYVSSPLTVETWGVRIEKAQKDKATWAEYEVDCSVDIPDETWPYCVGRMLQVPDGYSACVYVDSSLQLSVKKLAGDVGVMGKKIRN